MKARDPVCGMEVETETSEKYEYRGKTYYFCSSACRLEFSADPAKYIKAEKNYACR